MPELPEVEVVRTSLEEIFSERSVIVKVTWNRPDLRFPLPLKIFRKWKNVRVTKVIRRAKYLLLESEAGSLVCHLGMTGSFRVKVSGEESRKHDHVEFIFSSGDVLVFEDPRRFGFFLEWPGHWDKVTRESLGAEPLSEEWTAEALHKELKARKAPLKVVLMDQKVVVGIGNIYASEVLFCAKIKPKRISNRVSLEECRRLVECSRKILRAAIKHGGSSIRDFHSPGKGAGEFQQMHLVYGREKDPCVICSTPIRRQVLGGRSTFWCPHCQT